MSKQRRLMEKKEDLLQQMMTSDVSLRFGHLWKMFQTSGNGKTGTL